MKNALLLLAAVLFTVFSFAQETTQPEYLFSMKDVRFSGFGGPTIEFSQLDGDFAVSNGGGGALLINQKFFVGGYGMGISTEHDFPTIYKQNPNEEIDNLRINFGHGGLWLGYINNSHKLIHWGISTRIGGGGISLMDRNIDYDEDYEFSQDAVFVLSPSLEMEINLARWFKMNINAGYRLVTGISDEKYDSSAAGDQKSYYTSEMFNSPTIGIGFLFGGFGPKPKKEMEDKN